VCQVYAGFGAMSEIKDREHSCIVENVLIEFCLSVESSLKFETTNNIPANSILLTCWIKHIEHCFEGQQTAFMIITFCTAKSTDKAIQNTFTFAAKDASPENSYQHPATALGAMQSMLAT
jgi:hypothetical protein